MASLDSSPTPLVPLVTTVLSNLGSKLFQVILKIKLVWPTPKSPLGGNSNTSELPSPTLLRHVHWTYYLAMQSEVQKNNNSLVTASKW